jgi:hypothetical protein
MTANAPASKLPAALGLPLQILGAFAIFACVVGIWVKRDRPDSRLVYIYGDGNFRDAYRIVLRGEKPNNGDDVNQDALYLLRRYEWRASSK